MSPQDKRNNVPHLPLPAGEQWFAKAAGEGLPPAAAHVPRPGDDRTFGSQGGGTLRRRRSCDLAGRTRRRRAGPTLTREMAQDLPTGSRVCQWTGPRLPPSRNGSCDRRPHRAVSRPRRPDGPRSWRSPRPGSTPADARAPSISLRREPTLVGRLRYSLAAHDRAVRKGLFPRGRSSARPSTAICTAPSSRRRSGHCAGRSSIWRSRPRHARRRTRVHGGVGVAADGRHDEAEEEARGW